MSIASERHRVATLRPPCPAPCRPQAADVCKAPVRPGPPSQLPPPAKQIAERTVSSVGGFMVAGQRIQLGRGYAHQVVTAHLDEETIRVFHGQELVTTVPRVARKEMVVRKSGEHNRRKIV